MKVLQYSRLVTCVAQLLVAVAVQFQGLHGAQAEPPYTTFDTPRFTLYFGASGTGSEADLTFTRNVADQALAVLNATADEYSRTFGIQASKRVILKFLSPEEFRRQTGAPAWTSAMFYRGEISIPFTKARGMNVSELRRALRHEYVHAVFAEISDYKCPAWLDEGVAQLLEGQPNPLLGPALRKWAKANRAMPLDWLQNGFTTLDAEIVPAAYAESLFATRVLVEQFGYSSIVLYLRQLRLGVAEDEAFDRAFGKKRLTFERDIQSRLEAWVSSNEAHP